MNIGNKSKMRQLTLGIVIDQSLFQGGGFQASISDSLDLVSQITREKLIFFTTKKKNIYHDRKNKCTAGALIIQ